jgi:DNA-directed RNA polymerase specialized sigma24 family protein
MEVAHMDVAAQLDREWTHVAGAGIARQLPDWQRREPTLACFAAPNALLQFLHSAPAAETDRPLLALLRIARHDRLAGRLLLQVFLPALKTQSERIVSPAGRRDELWELLLFHAWETICCYPLTRRRRVAANLVLQVLHETTRELHQRSCPHDHEPLLPEHELWPAATADVDDRESRVEAAVAIGAISEGDAELVLCTRVDGIRLPLLADMLGVSYGALRKRRQRAEAALRATLAGGRDVPKPAVSDLVSYARRSSHRTRTAAATAATTAARATRAA